MKFISLMATMPSRVENLPVIRDNYLAAIEQLDGKATVEWHLAYWPEEFNAVGNVVTGLAPVKTLMHSVQHRPGLIPFAKSQVVLDHFCTLGFSDPDTFICLMSDDDLVGCKLFRKLAAAFERTQKPLLITSAARGQNTARSGHGQWPLMPCRQNMRQCLVTGEQVWIHQELFCGSDRYGKGRKLPEDDGLFIERLNHEHPDWLEFIPDAWMLFNALEPGRWTDLNQLHYYLNL